VPVPALAQANPIPLVVFGDSLSDPGNGFALVRGNATPLDFGMTSLLIPGAPYAIGGHHLSNGDTWIEQLAARFGVGRSALPAFASADPYAMNFAIGTARARNDGINPSLSLEIAAFLQKTGGIAPPGALYVIQVGANDVRDALGLAFVDPMGAAAVLQSAASAVASGVAVLYAAGARHFLVWNVPNLAVTPTVRFLDALRPGTAAAAAFATGLFNGFYLPSAFAPLLGLPELLIRPFDADGLMTAIVLSPGWFGFTNVTNACVTPNLAPFTCRVPDQYLFWDGIHPTKAAHGVIARAVAQLFGY